MATSTKRPGSSLELLLSAGRRPVPLNAGVCQFWCLLPTATKHDNHAMNRTVPLVLVLSLFGTHAGCTIVGVGTGAVVGLIRQPAPQKRGPNGEQKPVSRPMSTLGHVAIGGLIGFALDMAAIAASATALLSVDYSCDGPRC